MTPQDRIRRLNYLEARSAHIDLVHDSEKARLENELLRNDQEWAEERLELDSLIGDVCAEIDNEDEAEQTDRSL
jgi:hypothetical protein